MSCTTAIISLVFANVANSIGFGCLAYQLSALKNENRALNERVTRLETQIISR